MVFSFSIFAWMRIGPSAFTDRWSTVVSVSRESVYAACLKPEFLASSWNLVVELDVSCPPVVS